MSIWHSLKFESKRTAAEVLSNLLSSDIGLQPATYDQMKAEGLFGRVFPIDRDGQQVILEDYNLRANMRVTFDEDSDGNIDEGEKVMGKAITLILQQETGDAMFFHVADTPILKRVNGKISVVKESWSKWLIDALDKANLKYELKSVDEIQES